MQIDQALIQKLSTLAKLSFEGEELEAMQSDLSRIVSFVDTLNQLDTEGVQPLIHIVSETDHLREDEVKQWISKEEALKNAPKKDSDYIRVPKVLG